MKRGRHQAPAPQGDGHPHVNGLAAGGRAPPPHGVQLGHLGERQRHRLDEQRRGDQPIWHRPLEVLLGEPGHRPVHVDRRAEVVVRDLALGARHRRADGLPQPGLPVERLAGLRGGRGRRRRAGGRRLLDVIPADEAAGAPPRSVAGSMPSSAASLRAKGEILSRPGGTAWAAARADGAGTGAAGGAGTPGAIDPAGPSSWMMASTAPAGTVAPGWTTMRSSTPGANTSTSIRPLSVSISAMTSPRAHDVARLLPPGQKRTCPHVSAEDRHDELSHCLALHCDDCVDDVRHLRQRCIFQMLGVGHRHLGAAHACTGASRLSNARSIIWADTSAAKLHAAPGLVDDYRAMGPRHRVENRSTVQRTQGREGR